MNTYQALMKTAVLFEKTPVAYEFQRLSVPDCGSPGCAIGFVAMHMGMPTGWNVHDVCQDTLGVGHELFYERMAEINSSFPADCYAGAWTSEAKAAALCLRAYAARYHAPQRSLPRPVSAMVADLMARVTGPRIPDEVQA